MQMKSYEWVKLIATKENQDKIITPPTSIDDVTDWKELIEGLSVMTKCSYAYIKSLKDINLEDETPDMQELNVAGTNIQFATAQILATYNAFYDLMNKIITHNQQINDKTEKKA